MSAGLSSIPGAVVQVWRMVRHPRRLRDALIVWRDIRAFRRDTPFLAGGSSSLPVNAPVVLAVSLTPWITQVKIECLFLRSLAEQGYRPVVLTNRGSARVHPYFRHCGISMIFIEDLEKEVASGLDLSSVDALLDAKPTFASLHDFALDGVTVGRHVLSTLVRHTKQGSIRLDDSGILRLLRSFFHYSMRTTASAKLLLARLKPAAVLFLEKGYTPYGEICEQAIAGGYTVIQYVHGQKSGALVLKRYHPGNADIHCFSLSSASWESAKKAPWSRAQEDRVRSSIREGYEKGTWFNRNLLQPEKHVATPDETRRSLGIAPDRKIAVVFSHILWDATFFYGKNLFPDYEQWLIATVRAACANPNIDWLIKLHPDYVWKMKREGDTGAPRDVLALAAGVGALPPHVRVIPPDTPISTLSFFDIMDYAITVRGTVGIEAPCFGIPVFTAGTGRYAGFGFTHDSATPEAYLEKLATMHTYGRLSTDQTTLACRHAHALFDIRPLTFTSMRQVQAPLAKMGHILDHNVAICVHSIEELRSASDLQAFAQWVVKSKADDYFPIDTTWNVS